VRDYRTLDVWRIAHELALSVYRLSAQFPAAERYGLTVQIRRSATSAASNIVEGASRSSRLDFARFLDIAVGSTSECEYQLMLARDLGFVEGPQVEALMSGANQLRRKLARLRQRLLEEGPG
jgi:four helix bundle protein